MNKKPLRFSFAGVVAIAFLSAGLASADDRALLYRNTAAPYLFIVLDTSASMNRYPTCSQVDFDAGLCAPLCPTGDCFATLSGDDPNSKLYQAREAIYEVLRDGGEGINYGFATLNQDRLAMQAKHWLYRVSQTQPNGIPVTDSGKEYPVRGRTQVFGRTWSCSGTNIQDAAGTVFNEGCRGPVSAADGQPADVFSDAWEQERMERYSQLGIDPAVAIVSPLPIPDFFIRDTDAKRYKVMFRPVAGQAYGNATLQVDVQLGRCASDPENSCNSPTPLGVRRVYFDLVGQFYNYDSGPKRTEPDKGYFSANDQTQDAQATGLDSGLDPNSDPFSDPFKPENPGDDKFPDSSGYNLRWATTFDPADRCETSPWFFSIGDRLPLDWLDTHREDILERMAPNLATNPLAPANFGVTNYFNHVPVGSDAFLRLANEAERPIVATGRRPLGRAMKNFRQWFQGCSSGGGTNECPADTSWAKCAAGAPGPGEGSYNSCGCEGDPEWECRNFYLLVIAGGPETSIPLPLDPLQPATTGALEDDGCYNAKELVQARSVPPNNVVQTIVISFGAGIEPHAQLKCMAREGTPDKTGTPYTARTKDELVEQLTAVLAGLDPRPRDFATAVIPSVSTTSDSVAYLSQFRPRNNRSIWSGQLRAYFLDPTTGLIQADPDGLPLTTRFDFASGVGSLVWEAGNSALDLPAGLFGGLDRTNRVNPTTVLTAGTSWSDSTHDQATGIVGRNLFFGLRPGDAGCSSSTYECLVQIPAGAGGTPPAPPGTLPAWWDLVRDSATYAGVPGTVPETGDDRDQALQNSFSFIRGNRDVVVESLKISEKFTVATPDCASLSTDVDSPCYYGEVFGDVFHSNPVIVSFPENTRYLLGQDASSSGPGIYNDRGKSYASFFSDHRRRRKVIYAGADDGLMHAIDAGVFNADTTSFPGRYSLGSGREIFGFAPRAAVKKFYQLAHTITHDWTVDGAPSFDDVFIDVTRVGGTPQGVVSSESCGSPCTDPSRAWRTVLIGIEREGGSPITAGAGGGGSVFALDVTGPDLPENMNESTLDDGSPRIGAPQCLVNNFTPGSSSPPAGCSAPYPRILWELRDDQATSPSTPQPVEGTLAAQSTTQDLGRTWSRPVIGRIKAKVGTERRDFFVAIFGGGFEHTGPTLAETNASGGTANFLYMVDVETGKIIYKRNIGSWASGASGTDSTGNLPAGAPGEPGVVDINFDGYLDRVFIGDTQGRVWKVDISSPAEFCATSGADCPSANLRIAPNQWNPTLFFDEYQATTAADFTAKFPGRVRQPIFGRPSVAPIGTTATGSLRLAVAFGTGDRNNMPVLADTNPNHFVVVVDDPAITYPVFQFKSSGSDLTAASFTSDACTAANTCLNGKGYYLTLPVGANSAQIVNTNPLIFDRQIFFNTFLKGSGASCAPGGKAFIYKVDFATGVSAITDVNGNPMLPQPEPGETMVASDPVVYQSSTGQTYVVSATDDTRLPRIGGGEPPKVNVKSWKEQ